MSRPLPPQLLRAYSTLASFNQRIAFLSENPIYPEASALLAKLLHSLVEAARNSLDLLETAIEQEAQKWQAAVDSRESESLSEDNKRRLDTSISIRYNKLVSLTRDVNRLIKYFTTVSSYLRYIESSAVPDVPISLVRFLGRALQLEHPKSYLFVRRQWKPNFKYGEFVSQLSTNDLPSALASVLERAKFRIAMVSVPSLVLDDYLLVGLVAHEVGHYYDEFSPLEQQYQIAARSGNELASITQLAFKWEQELIADVYATLLIGPAYPFALFDFESLRFDLDQVFPMPDAYPSLRMRLRFALAALGCEKVGLVDYFLAFVSVEESEGSSRSMSPAERWKRSMGNRLQWLSALTRASSFPAIHNRTHRHAWAAINDRTDAIIAHAIARLTHRGLDAAGICHKAKFADADIDEAATKLSQNIPINEVTRGTIGTQQTEGGMCATQPRDIDLILNYGWMHYLTLQEDYLSATVQERADCRKNTDALRRLLRRSVDASSFHAEFAHQRDLFGEV